jgi:hypothetical protein
MKKIFTFLVLTIVNYSYSQDPRIFENIWYLTNVILDGANNLPPTNGITLNFSTPTFFSSNSCNTMYANVKFENNETNFSASQYNYTLNICTDIIASRYQDIYFPFFYERKNYDFSKTYEFTYKITELLGTRTLIINSADNQQAVYSSSNLSTTDFEKLDFSFSPNPGKDYLEVRKNGKSINNAIAEFYNELGQICLIKKLNATITKIELTNIASGIYFIKIKTENETITKKFIKI